MIKTGAEVAAQVELELLDGLHFLLGNLDYLELVIIVEDDRDALLALTIVNDRGSAPAVVNFDSDGLSSLNLGLPATNDSQHSENNLLFTILNLCVPRLCRKQLHTFVE